LAEPENTLSGWSAPIAPPFARDFVRMITSE
jgi:hypothetical protein